VAADDSPQATATSMGLAVVGFANSLARFHPDIILVVGDRFELLAVTCAALPLGIPIAHVSGGDVTVAAIDNQVRHAITKMSHIHFPDMESHGERLIQMGEEPSRVVVTGDPAIDLIHQMKFLTRPELSEQLGIQLTSPILLVTFHPTTVGSLNVEQEVSNLLLALSRVHGTFIFTYPNADSHNRVIIERITEFVASRSRAGFFPNLGQLKYYSLLAEADLMVGNSSSGIFEAPSFRLPVVNVGERQRGRLREKNVIDVEAEADAIFDGIRGGLEPSFRASLRDLQNPYGDGKASPRIVNTLKRIELGIPLLQKPFVDLVVTCRGNAKND
jgi:UDP-hydrolysing UDP-N-acetyl-D-glucosamine 2-epimerase